MTEKDITEQLQELRAQLIAQQLALQLLLIEASDNAKTVLRRAVDRIPELMQAQPVSDRQIELVRAHLRLLAADPPLK